MMPPLLKLHAKDAEDMQVISAVLQDSIVPVCDMAYRPDDDNFVLVTQRLCREDEDTEKLERICCAINIRGAKSAQISGLDLHQHDRMLELLMISCIDNTLTLVFAGEAKIKLELTAGWSMIVEDFGESWPSTCTPCHESDM